jgi:hypothetical protein
VNAALDVHGLSSGPLRARSVTTAFGFNPETTMGNDPSTRTSSCGSSITTASFGCN